MSGFCAECRQAISPTKAGLTPRQREAMMFIEAAYESNGVGPSHDEIAKGLGLESKSGVSRLVTSLEQRSYIGRVPGAARSIVPLVSVLPVNDPRTFEKAPKALMTENRITDIYDDRTYDDAGVVA